MSDDPLTDALEALAQIPTDVVPRHTAAASLDLTPGDDVVVTWPGKIITDVDGLPIGVEASTEYRMTVTDTGALIGWADE